jgi:hypothetical protein
MKRGRSARLKTPFQRDGHRERVAYTTGANVTINPLNFALVLSTQPPYTHAMGDHSAIEWTEATWNPTSGCTKVSPGCDRCYAERIALRFPRTFPNGFDLTLRPETLDLPLRWRRPRMIFVNSMSDLFHVDVPDAYISRVFDVMARASQHTYQILTKRAERLARLALSLPKTPSGAMRSLRRPAIEVCLHAA